MNNTFILSLILIFFTFVYKETEGAPVLPMCPVKRWHAGKCIHADDVEAMAKRVQGNIKSRTKKLDKCKSAVP